MAGLENRDPASGPVESGGVVHLTLILFGLLAPIATFAIAVSGLDRGSKLISLGLLAAVYLFICVWTFLRLRAINESLKHDRLRMTNALHSTDIDGKLAALDDAREFFGGSLQPADMYRLVTSRVNEIVPIAASALIVRGESHEGLSVLFASGKNAELLQNATIVSEDSLAGTAFISREIETTEKIGKERDIFPAGALNDANGSAAIPLFHDDAVFVVFQLFFDERTKPDDKTIQKLRAIGERVAPLFIGSMAFERSLSNALTDALTNLPNERAFYVVLENQLAESQRSREERPLTVLAIDLKNFDELNRDYGHATGDRALSFAAKLITEQLRKMDFLARSMNDEFVAVLPTASEKIAFEIIGRIQSSFAVTLFEVAENDTQKLWLNFGWATFWKDGETARQLIQNAQLRKAQAKSEEPSKVIWFPKEYVN
jgi:diguanylate cyclase (GGDEF)-like protein